MERVERVEITNRPAERPVQWWTGLQAALAMGVLFLLVSRGIPWASSGTVSPTVLGREIKDPSAINTDLAMVEILLYFVSCIVYASIMMPLIHRFRYGSAALVGLAIGTLLYLLNLAIFTIVGAERHIPASFRCS